jgi:hypothetical protein
MTRRLVRGTVSLTNAQYSRNETDGTFSSWQKGIRVVPDPGQGLEPGDSGALLFSDGERGVVVGIVVAGPAAVKRDGAQEEELAQTHFYAAPLPSGLPERD